jgi:hypothetical protein
MSLPGNFNDSFVLTGKDIDLAQLLALYPSPTIKGTGKLDISLPVDIKANGVQIRGGTLRSSQPGVLSYKAKDDPPGQLGFVMSVLGDYRYTTLEADLTLEQEGQLHIATRLSGSNPTVNKGQQVNVNLTIEENLPQLLKSIQTLKSPELAGRRSLR